MRNLSILVQKGFSVQSPPWDSAELLTNDEVIVEYLKVALEEKDLALFVKVAGNVARAKSLMASRTTSSGA